MYIYCLLDADAYFGGEHAHHEQYFEDDPKHPNHGNRHLDIFKDDPNQQGILLHMCIIL
jgi:hypothetical protein